MKPEILKIANLQVRRDFLKRYVEQFPEELKNLILPQDPTRPKDPVENNIPLYTQYLEQQIKAYSEFLNSIKAKHPDTKTFIDTVLLERQTAASAGVSRTVGEHFAQFQSQDKKRLPFGQLTAEEGFCFYWQTPQDAALFEEALKAHGLTVTKQKKKLDDSLLPESMRNLPAQERYQDKSTTVVRVPHSQVKQLLALTQYYPFELDSVIEDLYKGKTDRISVLRTERESNPNLAGKQETDVLSIIGGTIDEARRLVHVSVGAKAPSVEQQKIPPHFVLILDDSGSMDGEKIKALNAAMRKLIPTLPDDALISIQPLYKDTIAYRMTGKELKKRGWTDIPCPGSTPLLETIAGTATLIKKHPLDAFVSEDELARTMMVVLTDGQPNGGPSDTVAKLMSMMQESRGYTKLSNILPSYSTYSDLAFGSDKLSYTTLPIIFPASIGKDGDTVFMQELAKKFDTPHGFIREGVDTENDLETFLKQLSSLQGRESEAFVAITYTVKGKTESQQVKLRNLFHGYARQVFFEVPEGATNIKVSVINDKQFIAPKTFAVRPIAPQYLAEHLFDKYLSLKEEFNRLESDIKKNQSFEAFWIPDEDIRKLGIDMIKSTHFRSVQDVIKEEANYGDDKKAWEVQSKKLQELEKIRTQKKAEWDRLQETNPAQKAYDEGVKRIGIQVDKLLSMMPENQQGLTQEIQLFKTLLSTPRSEKTGYASVKNAQGRFAVAQFSQLRHQGTPWSGVTSPSDSSQLNDLFKAIADANVQAVTDLIKDHPEYLNGVDQFQNNVLMNALFHWKKARNEGKDCGAIQKIFTQLLEHPAVNILHHDARNNNIAHKAAWWGMKDALVVLIAEARKRAQLSALMAQRNTTHIGGTTLGEKPFDNILSGGLKTEEKQEAIKALYGDSWSEASIKERKWEIFTQPNMHFSPDGLTPLMVQLKWLSETKNPTEQVALRQKVMDYLEQNRDTIDLAAQSLHGNTALHFALYNEEYGIAFKILKIAEAKNETVLNDVLFARNTIGLGTIKAGGTKVTSGGEVPYLNLIANVKDNSKEFFDSVGDFFLQCLLEGTEAEQKESYKLVSTILTTDNPLQSSIFTLQKLQEKDPTRIDKIAPLLKKLEALLLFPQLYNFIHTKVDNTAKAEMGHLLTTYQKELEGYCAFNFLQQSPVIQAIVLKEKLDTMTLPPELSDLPKQLEALKSSNDPELAETIGNTITNYERLHPSIEDPPIQEVLTQAKILLAQQKGFVEKKTSDANLRLIEGLENAIAPLTQVLGNVSLEIQSSRVGFFHFTNGTYCNDLRQVEERLTAFIENYNRVVQDFADQPIKDAQAIRVLGDSLRTLCTNPENQVFKKHPGISGVFKNLLDWIAQNVFDSKYFQTDVQTEFEHQVSVIFSFDYDATPENQFDI